MSLEVARRGIDFVLANALELGEGAIEVAFHGGGGRRCICVPVRIG